MAVGDAAKKRKTSNRAQRGGKSDSGKGLAGNQHVNGVEVMTYYSENITSSPAVGPPYHEDAFTEGHRWTEAPGKVQPQSGNGKV